MPEPETVLWPRLGNPSVPTSERLRGMTGHLRGHLDEVRAGGPLSRKRGALLTLSQVDQDWAAVGSQWSRHQARRDVSRCSGRWLRLLRLRDRLGGAEGGEMAIAARAADSVIAKESERPDLDRLARVIRDAEGRVTLVSPSGESAEMPESVADVLRQVLPHFLRGDAVTLVAVRKHLTTQQAANILNVSRPYLVRLLDEEKIPHTRAGTHRRIALADLLAYRQERDRQRRQSLSRLTQLSQELGLYSSERRAGD